MNEEELKAIWRKNENLSLEKINFDVIKQKSIQTQNKLRQRIKREVITGILIYLALIPIFYFFPLVMLMIPVFIAIWVWYLWELKRIYKLETDFNDFENLKEVLNTKRKIFRNYLNRTRYITWFSTPLLLFCSFLIFVPFEQIKNSPYLFLKILIITQIALIIGLEIFIKFAYRPFLKEIDDLLQQLN